jgi:hypothetical protein
MYRRKWKTKSSFDSSHSFLIGQNHS